MNLIVALKKKLTLKDGKPRRGAFARAAEHIGVSHTTLHRYIDGECGIGKSRLSLVEDVANGRVDLSAKPLGRKPIASADKLEVLKGFHYRVSSRRKSKPRAKLKNNSR